MSRQKRILIVAGDSALAQTDLAKEAVPALGNFFELCATKGEIL
jgi:hypothetical protein